MAQRRRLDGDTWTSTDVENMSLVDILHGEDGSRPPPVTPTESLDERFARLEIEYESSGAAEPYRPPSTPITPTKAPERWWGGRRTDPPRFHAPNVATIVPDTAPLVDEMLLAMEPEQRDDLMAFFLRENRTLLTEPAWRTAQRQSLKMFEEQARCYVNTRGSPAEWSRLLGALTLRKVVFQTELRDDDDDDESPVRLAESVYERRYHVWTYELDEAFFVYCVLNPVALDFVYMGHYYAQSVQSHQIDIDDADSSSSSSSTLASSSSSPSALTPGAS